ncbi:(2Fe-2S)-binding protein [Puniceibacterium sp. IMCC21224]|uniref:(2Fe-2S)-binding protein n=1 Tax=Puniceibacterium sp. IMCC21224 TaxID=1618204 RepID=UPI00064DC920|nr:(2Fe-2S)-binding protein [Puniceibacterium sp. IMCC21224]KMK64544.1 aerobic-type carbon monoxide dehydrogenase, small subunit CoxS/CutS-like protein [Puniceibacterium sp. IMCC21224]
MTSMKFNITVNDTDFSVAAEPRDSLADVLRTNLGLTGTHLGCEHGVCGSCTVLINGQPARSCLTLAVQCIDHEVRTVEGLAVDGTLSTLQAAFQRHHALQCGFCTPGVLMSLEHLLANSAKISEADVRDSLSGHICRCTGYASIVAAAMDVAQAMGKVKS